MADTDSMRPRKDDLYVRLKTDCGTIAILARKAQRTPHVDAFFEKLSDVITEYLSKPAPSVSDTAQ